MNIELSEREVFAISNSLRSTEIRRAFGTIGLSSKLKASLPEKTISTLEKEWKAIKIKLQVSEKPPVCSLCKKDLNEQKKLSQAAKNNFRKQSGFANRAAERKVIKPPTKPQPPKPEIKFDTPF